MWPPEGPCSTESSFLSWEPTPEYLFYNFPFSKSIIFSLVHFQTACMKALDLALVSGEFTLNQKLVQEGSGGVQGLHTVGDRKGIQGKTCHFLLL